VALFIGPPVISLGGIVIAATFLSRASHDLRTEAAAAGFVLVAGGALATALTMQRILRDEVLLSLRTDGVFVQLGSVETFLPWDDVEDAAWDAERGALVLSGKGGQRIVLPQRFSGISGKRLAERVVATRRKAAMNLLR
jgi:hypothetical protein